MLKKLLLILLIFSNLSIYNSSFANFTEENYNFDSISSSNNETLDINGENYNFDSMNDIEKWKDDTQIIPSYNDTQIIPSYNGELIDWLIKKEAEKKDITSDWFEVPIWSLTPGDEWNLAWKSTEVVINMTLWNIIQKLMIGLGSVSLLVMTFWGWYMIFFHWQDELLSKWKSMFTSWIIALIVSLSSYYMVDLLRFILYS